MNKTKRGFAIKNFKDANGVECSIQKSSLATDDAIWLGANEIGLQEFVAYRNPAWQKVELAATHEHNHIANNRMHLTRKQVKKLLPLLQKFVETGELK